MLEADFASERINIQPELKEADINDHPLAELHDADSSISPLNDDSKTATGFAIAPPAMTALPTPPSTSASSRAAPAPVANYAPDEPAPMPLHRFPESLVPTLTTASSLNIIAQKPPSPSSIQTVPLSETLVHLHAILREESQKTRHKMIVCLPNAPLAAVVGTLCILAKDVGPVFRDASANTSVTSDRPIKDFKASDRGVFLKHGGPFVVDGLTRVLMVGNVGTSHGALMLCSYISLSRSNKIHEQSLNA